MKKYLLTLSFLFAGNVLADDYKIDTKGAHAFVQFKIQHLGYSWLYGRFDDFSGTFSFDENNPTDAKIEMTVNTASVNSNHESRDKHLRNDDFLDVEKFPTAHYRSTSFSPGVDGHGTMVGELTMHGVTKTVTSDVQFIGAGKDPWDGYRRGYEATTTLKLADFNIKKSLGPASETLTLIVSVEGIKQ